MGTTGPAGAARDRGVAKLARPDRTSKRDPDGWPAADAAGLAGGRPFAGPGGGCYHPPVRPLALQPGDPPP